jgi:hypothetical protein
VGENRFVRFGLILIIGVNAVAALACGRGGPPLNSLPPPPPPRTGAAACPQTNVAVRLVERLAAGGIKVTAVSGSSGEGLFRNANSVCLFDVGKNSFEVASFADITTASAVPVCETKSGDRYIYRLDDRTIDAAYPLYWSVSGADLFWTTSADLDRSLRRILSAVRPLC